LAGDDTKLRAQNSKKNNYNQKKIDRHLAYIEKKLAQYSKALEIADGDNKKELEIRIVKQKKHKAQDKTIESQLLKTGEKPVSSSDLESTKLAIRFAVTKAWYTVQSAVDAKYKIPIGYQVTNTNDKRAMT
jgi:hypothetical protein